MTFHSSAPSPQVPLMFLHFYWWWITLLLSVKTSRIPSCSVFLTCFLMELVEGLQSRNMKQFCDSLNLTSIVWFIHWMLVQTWNLVLILYKFTCYQLLGDDSCSFLVLELKVQCNINNMANTTWWTLRRLVLREPFFFYLTQRNAIGSIVCSSSILGLLYILAYCTTCCTWLVLHDVLLLYMTIYMKGSPHNRCMVIPSIPIYLVPKACAKVLSTHHKP